jgi:cytochrome c
MKFSRNLIVLFSSTLFIAACGGGTEKNATAKDTTASTSPAASGSGTSNPADDKAISLIAGSDCTTCHRLHQSQATPTIGPAYDQVAAKYGNAADTTVNRLVNKIVTGGSGIWGTTPMTPHPTLSKDDIKTMVTYILTLKQQ